MTSSIPIEYPTLDLNDKKSIEKFRHPYIRSEHRSRFPEILHYACHYCCDFLLCSVVENVTPAETHSDCGVLTPIGYIPSFAHSTTSRPLWLLRLLTQEETDIAWIIREHGAVINPIALEQISHFNVLTVVQSNHESEGMKHILLRTLLKSTESISLRSGAKLTEAASSASVLQTNELDEESEPESTESEEFFEQLVKDRKELNDWTFLRRIVQHWAETAKDQTYKADSKRRIDNNRLIRVKSAWLDNLRCACSVMKQIKVAEQMMKSLRNKWMTVQMFDLWDETSYSEHEAKMAKLVNSPTVEQEGPRQPMTETERIEARQALQTRSSERYDKIVLTHSFGSWVVCLAIRARLTRIKEQRSKSAVRKGLAYGCLSSISKSV